MLLMRVGRVLKWERRLLNFDANWYGYLYEEEQHGELQKRPENMKTTTLMITIYAGY